MKVAIHQPEYLGYLGFYNKMINADAYIFLDNVQLAKRDFVRRNRIMGQGEPLWLSVPVITKGRYYQEIREVQIDNTQHWRQSHWKSIQMQYTRTPFFKTYAGHFEKIYASDWERLADLNIALIRSMAAILGIERPFYKASELGVTGQSSQLLADLTLAVGGDVYLSGPMGRDYLEHELFAARALLVEYNDFIHPVYTQKGGVEFVPYLAAIDLLFNVGPTARDVIASGNPARVGEKPNRLERDFDEL
jgi:hypothetical protein